MERLKDRGGADPDATPRVGVIGCGRMGSAMVEHLLDAGRIVVVYDVDSAAVDPLVARGATAAIRASAVAEDSDVTLVIVVDDEQTKDVVLGEGGLLASAASGDVIALAASIHPRTCEEIGAVAQGTGVRVIDAALVGGERGAELGNLTIFCGGDSTAVARLGEALSPCATTVIRVGELGAGQVAKTANNVLMWAALRVDVETLRLARAFGVEPSTLRAALRVGTGANQPLSDWGLHRLRWPTKDLEVASAMAADVGLETPLIDSLVPLMAELRRKDLEDLR